MGSGASSLLESLTGGHPVRVVMLGLDSAGKSTVLYRMKFDQYTNTVPTIGFNCEKVKGQSGKAKGVNFMVWDVGGQDKLRPLWRSYTRSADGIVFVVDSVDVERMEEARLELIKTIRIPDNASVPVIIMANKQDLPGAQEPHEMEKIMALHELGPGHLWQIMPTCAINGEGLNEAMEVFYNMILKRRKAMKHGKTTKRK
ncbi:ADP-ribosylation factor-like protein 4C [Tubulanus polymorphus]|uniref:ADP-ribosylation factor-like protein 4C n=1 Tax=Tubulanus polymorphus TaxID=672921 RepID=UPI003DA4569D